MKLRFVPLLVAALTTASASLSIVVRPAAADDAMANMDCTQAESMLETAIKTRIGTLTGDVDKDFATIMMVHEKVGQRISQIEAKCGKNAKMQSMAAKDATSAQQRMDEFRNLGTSQ